MTRYHLTSWTTYLKPSRSKWKSSSGYFWVSSHKTLRTSWGFGGRDSFFHLVTYLLPMVGKWIIVWNIVWKKKYSQMSKLVPILYDIASNFKMHTWWTWRLEKCRLCWSVDDVYSWYQLWTIQTFGTNLALEVGTLQFCVTSVLWIVRWLQVLSDGDLGSRHRHSRIG